MLTVYLDKTRQGGICLNIFLLFFKKTGLIPDKSV
jgi:hypothetical protein